MTKSKLLLGSINATRLIDELKKGNKAFYKSQNSNDIFVNVKVWLNEEKDQFKNDASIQINPSAENKEDAKYIGNLRFLENKINEKDLNNLPDLNNLDIPSNDFFKKEDDTPF